MDTILLCFLIIVVRIVETSMATVRMMFTIKSQKITSTIIAFFEILIWFLIVKEAINTENNSIFIALSYALGFAGGTLVGMIITEKRMPTNLMVIAIFHKNKKQILKSLTENKFAFSILKVKGKDMLYKDMVLIVTSSRKVKRLERIILESDDKAFIVTNESKQVFNGYY